MNSSIPNDLTDRLVRLKLTHTAQHLDEFLARASAEHWSARRLLEQLTIDELEARIVKTIERRLKRSRLGRYTLMANFDWNWPRSIDRPLIENALGADFVAQGRNLIILGPQGSGKTMIAKNIGRAAAFAGFSLLYLTVTTFLNLFNGLSTEQRKRRFQYLHENHLLILDDLGYQVYDDRAADLLFLLIDDRHRRRRSILLATSFAFKDWTKLFPNAPCVMALVDRLTRHADLVRIDGPSFHTPASSREDEPS